MVADKFFAKAHNLVYFILYFQDQKPPQPPAYIFMIDVSYQSIQCGMVRMLMRDLGSLLEHLPRLVEQSCNNLCLVQQDLFAS